MRELVDAEPRALLDARRRTTVGVVVFAQPLVIISTAVWWANDHVLKDRYASWWTGKLSDVTGMIVFPLVIAVLIERRVRRPIHWAIAATAVFFGSINLFPAADLATERLLSVFLGPVVLTRDPTDLLVLPLLACAAWLWHTAPRADIRRSWGRIVFAGAIVTTLATSADMASSETISGTVWLTAEAPEVEIPVELTLDDGKAENLDTISVQLQVVPYGEPIIESDIDVTREMIEPGRGTITLALRSDAAAPAEVRWTMTSYTEGTVGFFGRSAELPVLTAQNAPASTTAPEPALELSIPPERTAPIVVRRLELETVAGATARIVVPKARNIGGVAVATDDEEFVFGSAVAVDVHAPQSCNDAPTCTYEVVVSSRAEWDGYEVLVLAGDELISATDLGAVELHSREISGRSSLRQFTEHGRTAVQFLYEMQFLDEMELPDDPTIRSTTVMVIDLDGRSSLDEGTDRFAHASLRGDPLVWARQCCTPREVTLETARIAGGEPDWPLDAWFEWRATLWSTTALPPGALTVSVE